MVRIYKNFPKRLYPYNLFNHFLRGQVWMVVWMCGMGCFDAPNKQKMRIYAKKVNRDGNKKRPAPKETH